MAAAENGALPGFKVGGIADVVQHLPEALTRIGCMATVVCPAYGLADALPGAQSSGELRVPFAGGIERVRLYRVPTAGAARQMLLDHPVFSTCGPGAVYCHDDADRPFATDATKFALFSAAVAEGLLAGAFARVDVVHLHDWHAALVLVLRRFAQRYATLRSTRMVFTIHNLGLQGVRPLAGDPSSLASWYPALQGDVTPLLDPRWADCVNPMAAAIRLADAVGTVSPTYANEILEPDDPHGTGRHGGEGLEADLRAANRRGALLGILNGCNYPPGEPAAKPGWPALLDTLRGEALRLAASSEVLESAHYVAGQRLAALKRKRPGTLLTTVGRVTRQKLGLLQAPTAHALSALDGVLDAVGDGGLYVILGSGDPEVERFLVSVSARRANLVFLRGYAEALAQDLYAEGDLFLMPSSYEPCGISQMIAMRAGQPCLVHAVGGLKDTVLDEVNGFTFTGDGVGATAEALVARLAQALEMRSRKPKRWSALEKAAREARFSWTDSALAYRDGLYTAGVAVSASTG
jgi:starch synthase